MANKAAAKKTTAAKKTAKKAPAAKKVAVKKTAKKAAAKKVPAKKAAAKATPAKKAAAKATPAKKAAAKKAAAKATPAKKTAAKAKSAKPAEVKAETDPVEMKLEQSSVETRTEAAPAKKSEPKPAASKKVAAAPAFPLFGALTERQMRSLGDKLDKLLDENGYKHYTLLSKSSNGPVQALLWHLQRCGLVGRAAASAGLYRRFAEYLPEDVTAADVISVLRHVPEDMGVLDNGKARGHAMLTPGVLTAIDELLVRAYVSDRAALLAARDELPRSLQLAIDFVRRRAGEEIDPANARELLEHLAQQHSEHGLALNIDVPRVVDGAYVEWRLADDEKVRELAELFGPREAYAAQQLAWIRGHVARFRSEADYLSQRTSEGLAAASLRDVIYLFGDGSWNHTALLRVLDARTDSPEELLAAATELRAHGLAPLRIEAEQVKPPAEPKRTASVDDDGDGGDDDDDYSGDGDDDDFFADDEHDVGAGQDEQAEPEPDAGPDSEHVRALAEALTVVAIERLHAQGLEIPGEVDAAFDLERVFYSDSGYIVRLRAALELLGPARAHTVIRRVLARQFNHVRALAIADVGYEAAMVEEVLARVDREGAYVDADLLGYCGPDVVPAVAAHAVIVADAAKRARYREAINYILARAAEGRRAWDPSLDEHIDIGQIQFSYGGSKVGSVLALLDGMLIERYEAVMRSNLQRGVDPVALVRCLRSDTSDALLAEVFTALLGNAAKITSGALGDRLQKLGGRAVEPLRRAFGDTPAQATLMRELERALGHESFAAFKATLDGPIETREQELRRLCAGLPGPKVTIYRLKRAERAPAADEVGRIGGAPRGVAEDAAPRRGSEAMEHVITLDLARLPGLGDGSHRSLSLYLPDPEHGSHHESGQLVWRSESELADAPGSVEGAAAIEVEAFDVPAAIFRGSCEGELKQVRRIVYGSSGYALGGPLWLQDGDEGLDSDFLFQFDESLCHINLGDSGVMYVFDGNITWQCH